MQQNVYYFIHTEIDFNAYILASNLSLWISKRKSPRSNGYLIEIDHWNETTKVKDTTVKYCDRMPEDGQNANCLVYELSIRYSSQKVLLSYLIINNVCMAFYIYFYLLGMHLMHCIHRLQFIVQQHL